jgi:hypothetical protein
MLDPRSTSPSSPRPSPSTLAADWRTRDAAPVQRVRELMAARRAAAKRRALTPSVRPAGAPLARLPRKPPA